MENIIDNILIQKYSKEEIAESNKLYAESQYCNSINLENVKPILIIRMPADSSEEIRVNFRKKVVEQINDKCFVIMFGTNTVKSPEFELLK
jgi:hypothetical protein